MTRRLPISSNGIERKSLEHVAFERLRLVLKDASPALPSKSAPLTSPAKKQPTPFGRGPTNEQKALRALAMRMRPTLVKG